MCGIFGTVNVPFSSVDLDRLSHRGPDSSGLVAVSVARQNVILGHRRLAIVDLSPAGHQPVQSRDGRWLLTYNGEIYNHQGLRAGLQGSFRGHSDTETLVEHLAAFGMEQTLPFLNGMFGFSAVDLIEEKLYLVRDPFGVKPLYYSVLPGGRLVFASEVRALRALPSVNFEVEPEALQTFLTLRYVPSPQTLWGGVQRLPPGHCLVYDLATHAYTTKSYLKTTSQTFAGTVNDAVVAYHEVLTQAIQRQMLSDVPVGVLLSGGVDSALVAALAKEGGRILPSFTVGFGAGYAECEIDDAAQTALALGLPHAAVTVTPDDLWQAVEDVVRSVEEPLGTTSILPMWHLVQRARRDVTVVLTGQGCDEPWGGYTRYQAEVLRKVLPLPELLKGLSRLRPLLSRMPEFIERAIRCIPVSDIPSRFVEAYAMFPARQRMLLTGRCDDGRACADVEGWLSAVAGRVLEPVEKMMRIDSRMNLADDLLIYGDKVSMAFSLEARVPMLDHDVINFVESLPLSYRVKLGSGKIVHKLMAERYLPASIVHRPKRAFQVPFGTWSKGIWREKIEEILMDSAAPHWSLLDRDQVSVLWKAHLSRRTSNGRQIFTLLMLAEWWRQQVEDI